MTKVSFAFKFLGLFAVFVGVESQQIWDIWQTTWDKSHTFTSLAPRPPLNFTSPGATGSANIVVDDGTKFQTIYGIGASLTDSSALRLSQLKSTNSANYWKLLNYLFDPTDGANSGGFNYIRIPIGASDFSAKTYSYDDTNGDTSFNNFNINKAPSYLWSTLDDIKSINKILKIHITPWSPPGWMKTTGTMNGGTITPSLLNAYATYLLKTVQGFQSKGYTPYAISIQNEPQNSNPTYPTSKLTPAQEAQIGTKLRSLLNSNGFTGVKLIGYDHNWNSAAGYPVQLMNAAPDAFDGVSFHCYSGDPSQQDAFHKAWPNKEIFFSECSGEYKSDWWQDVKWYLNNIFIGALTHNSHTGAMWNFALDSGGNPKLPGTSSCGGPGCRPIAQVNSDGSWVVHQEFYAMAHASKAIIPKDPGGPFGQRIGVSLSGSLSKGLLVGAYVTGRVNASDWLRYSLVVLNQYDRPDGSTWNPTSIKTTIAFKGMQATYTFPVGVTTLWWYAPPPSLNATSPDSSDNNDQAPVYVPVGDDVYGYGAGGGQVPFGF